jgi:hypothetical protein
VERLSQKLWAGSLLLIAMILVAGRIFAYFIDLLRKQVDYTRHANGFIGACRDE